MKWQVKGLRRATAVTIIPLLLNKLVQGAGCCLAERVVINHRPANLIRVMPAEEMQIVFALPMRPPFRVAFFVANDRGWPVSLAVSNHERFDFCQWRY